MLRLIHKFITKQVTPISRDTVRWMPKEVTYPPIRHGPRLEIFAQQAITIGPRSSRTLVLGFGVSITRGICLVSLRQDIKEKRCSLQDGTVSEDVEDIIITIQNNFDCIVTINEGDSLCYINYY
jgi:hypothetical protein